ncbi:MAG: TrbG/VirB9 family P-type conjugative transfer protein, partial [Lactobacillales bacterium]|nr:TrbG/VirB9 family P-type conjugative transfer protein [Lactobacillales bacterium]
MSHKYIRKISWLGAASLSILLATSAMAQQMLPTDVEAAQLSDAIAQTTGEFDAVNIGYIHSLGMQQKAWNDPMAHLGEGQTKPGYSKYNWTPDVVLPIRLREGMMTLINLPVWELIEKVHIGSPESFGGEIAAPNSLLVYADPSYIGVDSNMIIFGRSGNRYVFYLRSETYNTDKITQSVVDVTVGKKYTPTDAGGSLGNFNGATATAVGSTSAGAPSWAGRGQNPQVGLNTASTGPKDWLKNIPVDPEKFRFDVEMYLPDPSAVDIAPDNVWRDEIFTYIDLGPKALTMTQRPIVNLIVQESEVPVGFRTRGENSRLIVVEAVGDLVLRNGKKIICLKLRRDPTTGLEYIDYSGSERTSKWNATATNTPSSTGGMNEDGTLQRQVPLTMDGKPIMTETAISIVSEEEMAPMPSIPNDVKYSASASSGIVGVINQVTVDKKSATDNVKTVFGGNESISVELGTHPNIADLESVWEK